MRCMGEGSCEILAVEEHVESRGQARKVDVLLLGRRSDGSFGLGARANARREVVGKNGGLVGSSTLRQSRPTLHSLKGILLHSGHSEYNRHPTNISPCAA
jgi:hypothetical protein